MPGHIAAFLQGDQHLTGITFKMLRMRWTQLSAPSLSDHCKWSQAFCHPRVRRRTPIIANMAVLADEYAANQRVVAFCI